MQFLHNNIELLKTSFIGLFISNLSTEVMHLFDENIKPLYLGIDFNNLINAITQITVISITTYQLIKLAKINKNKK